MLLCYGGHNGIPQTGSTPEINCLTQFQKPEMLLLDLIPEPCPDLPWLTGGHLHVYICSDLSVASIAHRLPRPPPPVFKRFAQVHSSMFTWLLFIRIQIRLRCTEHTHFYLIAYMKSLVPKYSLVLCYWRLESRHMKYNSTHGSTCLSSCSTTRDAMLLWRFPNV